MTTHDSDKLNQGSLFLWLHFVAKKGKKTVQFSTMYWKDNVQFLLKSESITIEKEFVFTEMVSPPMCNVLRKQLVTLMQQCIQLQ